MYQVISPFQQFFDLNGAPLNNGSIYVGSTNSNPITNQIALYWDEAGTQPAAQPLKTQGGYIVRDGTAARVYLSADDYSASAYDKKGVLIFYTASVTSSSTLRVDLANFDGSSLIGFKQSGLDAVATTVLENLRRKKTVLDFIPLGTNTETTDCSVYIQKAIDALPAGYALDGLGLTYLVKRTKLKSSMSLQNFKFLTKGGAIPSEFWSPVTIGDHGDTSTYSDIDVINVHVNGQRLLNGSNAVGMSEDGGRHGFRIIGNVANVRFLYCSAKYCGSYGFFFYRGLNTAPIPFDDVATISNVKLIGCVSQYNKSHGGAADSINEFTIDGGTYTHNGLDYFTDPGALTADGKAYSCGFDFEGYGIGSWTGNVLIQNADMRHNASESLLFVDPVDTSDARFRIRDTIVIQNNQTDTGSHPDRLNPYSAIIVTAPYANFTHGSIYKNVSISGGNTLGEINYACVDDLRIDTPQTVTRGILGEGAYSNRVECVTSSKLKFSDTTSSALTYKREVEYDEGSFTPVISSGSGSITSYTASGSYVKIGKLVTVTINYTITTNGTGAAYGIIGSLPFSASVVGGSGSSRLGGTTGEQCSVSIAAGNTAFLWKYSNAYPWVDGVNGTITLSYITN